MPVRATTLGALAGAIAVAVALTAPVQAQTVETPQAKADSAPHFALFGGPALIHGGFALGGSGDFRWSRLPVPLRLSVGFANETDQYYRYGRLSDNSSDYSSAFYSGHRTAMASLELVMRPIPKKLGIQPYLLGGVGVGTRASSFRSYYFPNSEGIPTYQTENAPRETAAFLSFGIGFDIGRLFVQGKAAVPIASNSQPITPQVNVGFRFWD